MLGGLVELVESQVTALRALLVGGVAFVGVAGGGLDLLASTAGTWFPLVAVSSSFILPEFGLAEFANKLLLLAAFTYVGILAARLFDKTQERFGE